MSRAPMHRDGPVAWLTTTDHKKIGILYCVTAFGFFLIGGTLADVMRTELAETGRQLVTPQAYNGLFTIHGIVMIFLFVAPFGIGPGELPDPAADRRARHGVPAAERAVVLVLRGRRVAGAAVGVRLGRRAARRPAGTCTRRCRGCATPPAWGRIC